MPIPLPWFDHLPGPWMASEARLVLAALATSSLTAAEFARLAMQVHPSIEQRTSSAGCACHHAVHAPFVDTSRPTEVQVYVHFRSESEHRGVVGEDWAG